MTLLQETEVPNDIAFAARRLNRWMEEHGHRDWQLMGVCSRGYAFAFANLMESMFEVANRHHLNVDRTYAPVMPEGVTNPEWVNANHEIRFAVYGQQEILVGLPPGTAQPMTPAQMDAEIQRLTVNEAARPPF